MPALTNGDSLGPRYSLIRRLGGGATGEVWLVEDHDRQLELVAKIVQSPTDEQIEQLREEWRLGQRLAHSAVARVFDFEQRDDLAFLTMERVDDRDRPPVAAPTAAEETEVRLNPPPKIVPRAPRPSSPTVAAPTSVDARDRRLRWATGIAFAILAVAAITVFAVLPGWVDSSATPAATVVVDGEVPATEPTPPLPSVPPAAGSRAEGLPAADPRDLAVEAGESARERIEKLESQAASVWAGEEFAQLKARLRRGDQRLLEGEIETASDLFQSLSGPLGELETKAAEALEEAVDTGKRALARGDSAAAREAFELAVRIAPGDSRATDGLRRSESLPTLLAHLDSGAERERSGDLRGALDEYRRAAAIEPGSAEARSAIGRLTRQLEESEFGQVMAQGFAALESGAHSDARDSFMKAATMRPGSAEAKDGIARAEAGLRTDAISAHRHEAEAAVEAEDWHAAARHYGQVLEIDASLAFARQGQERSRARAELADSLTSHLQHRQRLATPGVLERAREALDEAREVAEPGPVLARQIGELERSVIAYSTPRTVVLRSDDLTEVEIYRVGHQGAFDQRQLELLPGTYTIVGRRRGYQDVRVQLVVAPGEDPKPLTVRCESRI